MIETYIIAFLVFLFVITLSIILVFKKKHSEWVKTLINIKFRTWFILLFIVKLLDAITTWGFINKFDINSEANPIFKWSFNTIGGATHILFLIFSMIAMYILLKITYINLKKLNQPYFGSALRGAVLICMWMVILLNTYGWLLA